jgi:hypothetical protein
MAEDVGPCGPFYGNDGAIVKWVGSCTDIHDLVEARQEAKQTQTQLLQVIEHAYVTPWAINRDRRILLLDGNLMWNDEGKDTINDAIGVERWNSCVD